MADFKNGSDPRPIKMMYLGHSGAGKTGSLMSLAAAGYNVRILDLDNGVDVLRDYALNTEKSIYRKAKPPLWTQEQADSLLDRISYVTVTEGHNIVGTKAIPKGDSWAKIGQLLNNWTDGPERKFGNLSAWTQQDVLVIDSFSRLCDSAMNFHLALNGRLAEGPRVGRSDTNDYTAAYKYVTELLDLIKSTDIKCHVIFVCHIVFIGETQADRNAQTRDLKGFPQTIGPALSPKVGQYFNHSLRAKSIGTGLGLKRVIIPNNDENIELKNTVPLRVAGQYDLATGLAEYFKAVQGAA